MKEIKIVGLVFALCAFSALADDITVEKYPDAAISGLPVIASDWQYAQEIIGHGRCGLLFPVGDNGALTDNMRAVINDRGILEPMRRNALERSGMYDVEKVLTRELIERLGMDKPVY